MRSSKKQYYLIVGGLITGLVLLTLPVGCGTTDGGNGGSPGMGALAGTLTNTATGSGMSGIVITLSPEIEGMEITSDDNGGYSANLPAGIYMVSVEDERFDTMSESVSVIAGQTTVVDFDLTPLAGVILSAAVDGEAVPGATLNGSTTIEVLDGSTVQSVSWSQSNSVDVTISGGNTETPTITLPGESAYKAQLLEYLAEPPVTEDQLPENVPLPEGEFPAGLQDRFYLLGLNNFDLEEAGLVTLRVAVTTTSGTYTQDVEIHTELPFRKTLGIQNVPLGNPVLLHGKTQQSYNWALSAPAGSGAALNDATTQNPDFTPDVAGLYRVTVTDRTITPTQTVTLEIMGGTWEGAITGQDMNGRPVAANCTACHNDSIAPDMFTDWAQTGHAEIFSVNVDTSTHYSEECFSCHTVGFETGVDNGGCDEASDYEDFLNAGLLNNPGDNWTTVLSDYPDTAKMANIQCENCHGPQNGGAHTMGDVRVTLSSDMCGFCHGEPLRHARFQQWQLSGHANYELAVDEGESGSCARCHTANGFLAWLPILMDDDPATDPLDDVAVTWTADEVHPQTCVTCHDPHNIGTSTGVETDATVRIYGDTPPLIAGFTVHGAGNGALCMTCHNSRRGLRNDNTYDDIVADGDAARAPHGSPQTDVLMGENAFLVNVGVRGSHSLVEDTCVNCHMEATPPPDVLAYNLGGTNHTFFAGMDICANCHSELDAKGLQSAFEASVDRLGELIVDSLMALIADQIDAGNTIDLNGEATITDTLDIADLEFGESHGRQAITVTFENGTIIGPVALNSVRVQNAGGADLGELYDFADEALIKSGWNWNLANNDGSKGVHNPSFVFEFLDASIDALDGAATGS